MFHSNDISMGSTSTNLQTKFTTSMYSVVLHALYPFFPSFSLALSLRSEKTKEEEKEIERKRVWVEKRGYDSEYIFTTNTRGQIKPISKNWGNRLCEKVLSQIIGRRITVHNFKASIATRLLEQGVDMAIVSKEICKHEDISVTQKFYDLRTFEEQKEDIFKNIKI